MAFGMTMAAASAQWETADRTPVEWKPSDQACNGRQQQQQQQQQQHQQSDKQFTRARSRVGFRRKQNAELGHREKVGHSDRLLCVLSFHFTFAFLKRYTR
jgi:hypothetical protein